MEKTKIKLCGLFRPDDIIYANEARPDYAGFILTAGYRRSITVSQAARFRERLDSGIQAVGVFVNASREEVVSCLQNDIIQAAQLHGQETEEDICYIRSAAGRPVLKAVTVREKRDVESWLDSRADCLLFDSGAGTGRTFDWNLLADVGREYFLAGGLHMGNLEQALSLRPYAVDLSSGVETDGYKDPEKMRAAVELVRRYGIQHFGYPGQIQSEQRKYGTRKKGQENDERTIRDTRRTVCSRNPDERTDPPGGKL